MYCTVVYPGSRTTNGGAVRRKLCVCVVGVLQAVRSAIFSVSMHTMQYLRRFCFAFLRSTHWCQVECRSRRATCTPL